MRKFGKFEPKTLEPKDGEPGGQEMCRSPSLVIVAKMAGVLKLESARLEARGRRRRSGGGQRKIRGLVLFKGSHGFCERPVLFPGAKSHAPRAELKRGRFPDGGYPITSSKEMQPPARMAHKGGWMEMK